MPYENTAGVQLETILFFALLSSEQKHISLNFENDILMSYL